MEHLTNTTTAHTLMICLLIAIGLFVIIAAIRNAYLGYLYKRRIFEHRLKAGERVYFKGSSGTEQGVIVSIDKKNKKADVNKKGGVTNMKFAKFYIKY